MHDRGAPKHWKARHSSYICAGKVLFWDLFCHIIPKCTCFTIE
uniref:Uncharacterized protein n=1 Tax=Arundo donax TaxID=35708 RepID=A0A0A9C513_ARUDO